MASNSLTWLDKTARYRLHAAQIKLQSLEEEVRKFEKLIMEKHEILHFRVAQEFEDFLASEKLRLQGARAELNELKNELGWEQWEEVDLADPCPAPVPITEQTPSKQPSRFPVKPLQAVVRTRKIGNEHIGLDLLPLQIAKLSSCFSAFYSTIPPISRTDSGLPTEQEDIADETIDLSPQEQEAVSNFLYQEPPPSPTFWHTSDDTSQTDKWQQGMKDFAQASKTRIVSFSKSSRSKTPSVISQSSTLVAEIDISSQISNMSTTPVHYSENPRTAKWIMDNNWLCVSTPASQLAMSESRFATSSYQAGLLATDQALSTPSSCQSLSSRSSFSTPTTSLTRFILSNSTFPRRLSSAPPTLTSSPPMAALTKEEIRMHGPLTTPKTVTSAQKINLHLIRSCALLVSSQPLRALKAADIALKHADNHEIAYLISKSRIYRGLALLTLGRWREAECDFGRAGGVRGWGVRVGALREACLVALRGDSIIGDGLETEVSCREIATEERSG